MRWHKRELESNMRPIPRALLEERRAGERPGAGVPVVPLLLRPAHLQRQGVSGGASSLPRCGAKGRVLSYGGLW